MKTMIGQLLRPHFPMNKAGRPTDYHGDMAALVEEYAMGGYKDYDDIMPSLVGLTSGLKVCKRTIQLWRKEYKDFDDACLLVLEEQQRLMALGAMTGQFNHGFTKFLLSACHGYSEKTETKVDHTSSDGSVAPAVFKGVGESD